MTEVRRVVLALMVLAFSAVLVDRPHVVATTDDEVCLLVAEISTLAVQHGAFAACLATKQPLACAVATAAEDVATKEVAKAALTTGCAWSVKKVRSMIRIDIRSTTAKSKGEVRRAYEILEAAEPSLRFIQRPLP